MTQATITRRQALAGAAALPLATAAAGPARASAPMLGPDFPTHARFRLGGFEVTTLLAGTRMVPNPQEIFGLNVSEETFAEASAEAMIPTDTSRFFFTPTVVNTGEALILFDTGLAPAATVGALESAGYTADQVTHVALTHMHGDHIGGLMEEGSETFAGARYLTGAAEFDAWDFSGDETFEAKVRPLSDAGKLEFLEDGDAMASGVTAVAAFGHTAGHMAFMLESEGRQLLLGADFANHYIWSLANPDWEVLFDRDKEQAAATRRRLLGMLAADKVPFVGYHMPFPGLGYVETAGDGFRYVPHSYQLTME